MFHKYVPHVHETSPGKNTIFLSIYLPHLRRLVPSSYWTSAGCATLSIQPSPDVISVRQTRDLPPASFRFLVAENTLALDYTLPTTRACSGLAPVRLCPCWAHIKKEMNPVQTEIISFIVDVLLDYRFMISSADFLISPSKCQ